MYTSLIITLRSGDRRNTNEASRRRKKKKNRRQKEEPKLTMEISHVSFRMTDCSAAAAVVAFANMRILLVLFTTVSSVSNHFIFACGGMAGNKIQFKLRMCRIYASSDKWCVTHKWLCSRCTKRRAPLFEFLFPFELLSFRCDADKLKIMIRFALNVSTTKTIAKNLSMPAINGADSLIHFHLHLQNANIQNDFE